MSITHRSTLMNDLAEFFAGCSSHDEILNYRAAPAVQQRATELIARLKSDPLSIEEERELDELTTYESFLGLVQARLRVVSS